eukprot:10429417-Alexandrium_andersonii.AAC.1
MSASLVGSEMCIRDRTKATREVRQRSETPKRVRTRPTREAEGPSAAPWLAASAPWWARRPRGS